MKLIESNEWNYLSGGKKCSFFGKFGGLRFLETPVSIPTQKRRKYFIHGLYSNQWSLHT